MSFADIEKKQQHIQDEELARRLQEQEDAIGASAFQVPAKKETFKSERKTPQDQTSLPAYRAEPGPPTPHTNPLIEASKVRAKDEQQMQNWLQRLQYQYKIYNSEIEPEHEADYPCGCPIHQYQRAKCSRYDVLKMWSKAVMYPGEKAYTGNNLYAAQIFTHNPYANKANFSPYPFYAISYGAKRPSASAHATWVTKMIKLNNSLNVDAQRDIDSKEPKVNIWNAPASVPTKPKQSFWQSLKKGSEENSRKTIKAIGSGSELRAAILAEEKGRWPSPEWRAIVLNYQNIVGMAPKIAYLREHQPIQYLHLLRAGYFEPIPVAWATQASNPLKFVIEASEGWRGITPSWRGYEDTAEERLYWVLNHREGSSSTARMKPDFISALDMARDRMARAVAPPPDYFDANDVCQVQDKSHGYSKQVMPPPFRAYDRPETSSDDTMILLDTSGSMDFNAMRPVYEKYLITNYVPTGQPKNKDVAKAIIKRFTLAMENHDHSFNGYDLVSFANSAQYIGSINHTNLDALWRTIEIGGGTRVMTGWQQVKDLHFQKHSASAFYHPVYGWQAGPDTPILRLLLLLDGEATDMDEFELDLLGCKWAHVTIFLIGVDGCPHHHRHANELQRISDVNPHVAFVDAQGNTPERFVTHELLKRHLGYDVTMAEFTDMERPPGYDEVIGS